MARPKSQAIPASPDKPLWRAALYARLSREDGDKPESDSIANQRLLLEDFAARQPGLQVVGLYVDDGCTGTNFRRPEFQRMLADLEAGRANCVIVKDLSRFGRDYIDMGRYLERWFPEHGVRFLAVNDGIDSENGPYDMLLPVKNVFNEQYARDISRKVRSAMQAKQRSGAFVGAFACYGYRKDPRDHNRLVVDPPAAQVVRRVFSLYEQGMGQQGIARLLNREGVPCPSEYKRLNGERYSNGRRLDKTTYWTYATVHRMLGSRMYTGSMEQGRAPRQGMHGKARRLDPSRWTVVEGTHEPIIGPDQWGRVQGLLRRAARTPDFQSGVSPFAGFLFCGECGRAMCKTRRAGEDGYCCGSYKRYGAGVCSRHGIARRELERVVLDDLNQAVAQAGDLESLAEETRPKGGGRDLRGGRERIQGSLDRLYRLKKSAYEDYRAGLLGREDYLRYRDDYTGQEQRLSRQLEALGREGEDAAPGRPWVEGLLRRRTLEKLDRATMAEAVERILVFADGHVEITYRFAGGPDAPENAGLAEFG